MSFYGHASLYALRSAQGFLCYHWWGGVHDAVVLFTDPKAAKAWIKAGSKGGKLELNVQLQPIRSHPPELKPAINPSVDSADITRIASKMFWQNW